MYKADKEVTTEIKMSQLRDGSFGFFSSQLGGIPVNLRAA
jgi:hypothetical protein